MKRFFLFTTYLFSQIFLIAQTQYDYMEEEAVGGGVNIALNGIIIIVALVIVAIVLLFIIDGVLKIYEWINPKSSPNYKMTIIKQEQERKHEEYVQEQRKNATPHAIDIGLSVKWASFNLGAYKPTDIGSTFYWAENQPSTIGHPKYMKSDIDVIGDIAGHEKYDAATNMLGENWRLPTVEECKELLDKCTWEIKVIDGIEGRLITGPNGNNIFLPFNQKNFTTGRYISGHYWTSTPQHWKEDAYDLRFGENCNQLAEIWHATTCRCLFCIRPVFTTISREMSNKQKQIETRNAYAKIHAKEANPYDSNIDYKYYQEQCTILNEEKKTIMFPSFNNDKVQKDEHGVIYSLDGKKLLDGSNCNCKTYKIKEGTEYVCNYAFIESLRMKKSLEQIILPSTLIYIPTSAIPDDCTIHSISPNYSVINDLLIDTRKKSIVKCLNKHILKVEIYEPIEEIGEFAFSNCRVLRSVVLPISIRIIGQSAFHNCEMLCNINLPDSIDTISAGAFFNCRNLHINHLPTHISIIGNSAFEWCIIDDINIPRSIKEIGNNPFSKYTKRITSESSRFIIENSLLIDINNNELIQLVDSTIKHVLIPKRITKIRDSAFSHTDITSITIPSTIKYLGGSVFWGCKNLTRVQFDCKIERLPSRTFGFCSSLSSFNVPECIKEIELEAFYHCINLIEITLNNGLQAINNRAFEECKKLESITIPPSIKELGVGIFRNCENLAKVQIDCKIERLPEYIFANCSSFTSFNVSESIKVIEYGAFENCSSLTSFNVSESIKVIKFGAFKNCYNIKDVSYNAREAKITNLPQCISNLTIGNHVKKLPKNFLSNNPILEKLIIPDNVQIIEEGCIVKCDNLKEIHIFSKDIIIEKTWIKNCNRLRTIKVHVNAYNQLTQLIPKGKKIKVKKIYGHQLLFFKW